MMSKQTYVDSVDPDQTSLIWVYTVCYSAFSVLIHYQVFCSTYSTFWINTVKGFHVPTSRTLCDNEHHGVFVILSSKGSKFFPLTLLHSERPKLYTIFGLTGCNGVKGRPYFRRALLF